MTLIVSCKFVMFKLCLTKTLFYIKLVWFYLTIFVTQKLTEGAVDNFAEHDDLNQCDQFDMNNSPPTQIRVTLLHEGTELWITV